VLWVKRPRAQKGADVEVGNLTTRGRVRFVPDEHTVGFVVAAQKTPVSICAAIAVSGLKRHVTSVGLH
jgi:hypothetical protein